MDITVTEKVLNPVTIPLPIVPLYTLEASAAMMGTSVNSLRRLLHRNRLRLQPLYIVQGRRRKRVLTGDEMVVLQGYRVSGPGKALYLEKCRGSNHE